MTNYTGTQVLTDVGRGEAIRQLGEAKTLTVTPENIEKYECTENVLKGDIKFQQQSGVIPHSGK